MLATFSAIHSKSGSGVYTHLVTRNKVKLERLEKVVFDPMT